MGKVRVLVVDDSAFMRLLLSDLLSQDSEIEIVGTANDGKDGFNKTMNLDPDVVLLDMNMGDFDGKYAIEKIMSEKPKPILILSSQGNTDLKPILEGLELGAVDYMNKPVRSSSKIREIGDRLIHRVKKVAKANLSAVSIEPEPILHQSSTRPKNYDVVAIGASTGGPTAIESIIKSLPIDFRLPILIVQHMPANFIDSFVDRLNGLTRLEVVVGKRGMLLRPGRIIVAPGENMIVSRSGVDAMIDFTDEQYREYNKPSINALMDSVADCFPKRCLGILLTGMGKDGVKGLMSIKSTNGLTIAQDKSSSVIYGMPKVAYETGAAKKVLSLTEISSYLTN